ncbi:uncharacterized protein RJT21DRAFT_21814 [Scheffersomyces amazonensis]|uniref:uncharacterized protein n=1 Tax=Scheffersomyces amazonensis TaxID=1078765 RepID=UPI00315C6A5E
MIRHSLLRASSSSLIRISRTSRTFSNSVRIGAKGDSSTIDSFKLPSQTSINEWEYKYDFIPKVASPKVPPVTKEAIKQDIAQEKLKEVERELFVEESNSSIKVEGNIADVTHGGESVKVEPEYLQDRGSKPVLASSKQTIANNATNKPANSDKYIHSSVNPNVNQSDVVSLGENEVDHKVTPIQQQEVIVEDIEHDNLQNATSTKTTPGPAETNKSESSSSESSGSGYTVPVLLLGLGGAGYYYYSSNSSNKK